MNLSKEVQLQARPQSTAGPDKWSSEMMEKRPKVLIVDDEPFNIDFLEAKLMRLDYDTISAERGQQALQKVAAEMPDVILLDIMMPEMDGFQVLDQLKSNNTWRHIPVIIISAIDELSDIVKGIEMGAEDYLSKPINSVLLQARLAASLEKKRWRDQEQAYLAQIQREREEADRLLLNILPEPIAARLKQGETLIVNSFFDVTVLFADIVDFTVFSSQISPQEVVSLLSHIFSEFDRLAEQFGLEKIKTIGDAYMAVAGLPLPQSNHAQAAAEMALAMQQSMPRLNSECDQLFNIRLGLHSGPVVAGVIDSKKFSYDLWGDTVNTASRMEAYGLAGRIHVSQETYQRLRTRYAFEERGPIAVKNKGQMFTYWLTGKKEESDGRFDR